MDRCELQSLIDSDLSVRGISAATGKSYTTVRYWLKKYQLQTRHEQSVSWPYCVCGETDPKKFYRCRAKKKGRYCKSCFNKYQNARWIERKRQAIKFKGGKCENCGLESTHYSIYDFHHRRGSKKDLNWSQLKKMAWPTIVEELEKCDLLCSNCHRIEHEGNFNCTYHDPVV